MGRPRGFTLIELVVVVAMIAILATAAAAGFRAASRNASLSRAAYQLAMRLAGLRAQAMAQGRDHLFVFVDAPGSDASQCTTFNSTACARYFVLAAPAATWTIASFDPNAPAPAAPSAMSAEYVEMELLPTGAHLDTAVAPPAMRAPFGAVLVHDAELTAACTGGRRCFAIRYRGDGTVSPEFVVPPALPKPGYSFVLGSDLNAETRGADRRGLLVSFPAGIVKTYAF